MMAQTKTLLLLDFGAVISRTIFETHAHTERVLGLARGALTWLGPIDPSTDPLWTDMMEDRITERNYWEQRAREVGDLVGEPGWAPSVLLRRAREGMTADDVTRPEALALVSAAREADKTVGILSNELELFFGKDWRQELPIFDLMDGVVDASDGGPMKPDAQAYARGLAAFDAQAADAVFVDDQPRNVQGAAEVGLTAIQFDIADPELSFRKAAQALDIEALYQAKLIEENVVIPPTQTSSG
jgi:putative hydrolase of the HAD superfamily